MSAHICIKACKVHSEGVAEDTCMKKAENIDLKCKSILACLTTFSKEPLVITVSMQTGPLICGIWHTHKSNAFRGKKRLYCCCILRYFL